MLIAGYIALTFFQPGIVFNDLSEYNPMFWVSILVGISALMNQRVDKGFILHHRIFGNFIRRTKLEILLDSQFRRNDGRLFGRSRTKLCQRFSRNRNYRLRIQTNERKRFTLNPPSFTFRNNSKRRPRFNKRYFCASRNPQT